MIDIDKIYKVYSTSKNPCEGCMFFDMSCLAKKDVRIECWDEKGNNMIYKQEKNKDEDK